VKPYKFLVPVGIAASALAGNAVKAKVTTQPEARIEQVADSSATSPAKAFLQKYVANGEEHTLLLTVSGHGTLYAQHVSHVSHASHASHASHSSHTSGV